MDWTPFLRVFISTVIYTVFGTLVFAIAFSAIVKLSPFSIRSELESDHNVAVAILISSVILGLAIIIAAAIHG